MAERPLRWRSVRGRSALLAAIVVFVSLTIASIAAVLALRSNLVSSLDDTLLQQARDRAALIDTGTDPAVLTDTLQEEALVWIGTPDGAPVAVGAVVIPIESPVPDQLDGVSGASILVEERKPDEVEQERMDLRLASATTADGSLVVLAGAETESIDDAAQRLTLFLALDVPLVTLLVAWLAWNAAGRALRPVDAIRAQTLEISGASLSDRVPVPEGDDEIHALAVTMNDMLRRLEEHEASLRRFTSDASHELRSPVANLRALVETTDPTTDEWPHTRARLVGELDRLRDLVDNLLFLASRDDRGSARTSADRIELDELLFAEAELLSATTELSVDVGSVTPVIVDGDRRSLHRLIRNLADNAARHARSAVSFAVVDDEQGSAVLEIGDDGPGIPASERERVFERFTRLDEGRSRDAGGSGLGLAIVQRIVTDHDGAIEIVERDGGGTIVRVTLPTG